MLFCGVSLTSQATAIIYVFEGMGHYRSCALTLYIAANSIQFIHAFLYPCLIESPLREGFFLVHARLQSRSLQDICCSSHVVITWQSAAFLRTWDLEPFCMT